MNRLQYNYNGIIAVEQSKIQEKSNQIITQKKLMQRGHTFS